SKPAPEESQEFGRKQHGLFGGTLLVVRREPVEHHGFILRFESPRGFPDDATRRVLSARGEQPQTVNADSYLSITEAEHNEKKPRSTAISVRKCRGVLVHSAGIGV